MKYYSLTILLISCLLTGCSQNTKQADEPHETVNLEIQTPQPENAQIDAQEKLTKPEPTQKSKSLATPTRIQFPGPNLIPTNQYGYSFWLNGFRKNTTDLSPDILAIETGYYGLQIDIGNLEAARFSRLISALDLRQQLLSSPRELENAQLSIQLASAGKTFTAKKCLTGARTNARRLQDNRLWEAGRYVQNFELQHLIFEDETGNQLGCDGRLEVVSWPDSLTLTAEITPRIPFQDGPTFGIKGNGHATKDKAAPLASVNEAANGAFTLECWVNVPSDPTNPNHGWLVSKNGASNENGHLGFYLRGHRIEASVNIGGGKQNRHILKERKHKLFNFDSWNHLVLTYDGQKLSYYINGRLEDSKDINQQRTSAKGTIVLGSDGKSKIVYGRFDQVRLWNRSLSVDEIEQHTQKPTDFANQQGLLYEKTFDNASDPKPRLHLWQNVTTRIQLATESENWEVRSPTHDEWPIGTTRRLTLNCDLTPETDAERNITVLVDPQDGSKVRSKFTPEFNCQVAEVKKLNRKWDKGYTDIRNYDEFTLSIDNTSNDSQQIPFMLYLRDVANITGLVPILCLEDGTPTGIPVQISKNWHDSQLGSYLRAYALLPAQTGKTNYKLRITYGFYGTLPAASHAQLSLVGYGGNGRWDQLAIGCWGETICFDVDRSCVDVAVTDVRMLMARTGKDGKKWSWTNAGWGGDWLKVLNADGKRLHPSQLKTAYHAQGPCLTDVDYNGNFGPNAEVAFEANVKTLRTDDYARTFQKLKYTFNQDVSAKDAWLLKIGRTHNYETPNFAYGNLSGLAESIVVPNSLQQGDTLYQQKQLTGQAPWWLSFQGAKQTRVDSKGNGYRALIIRDYKAIIGGKEHKHPSFSVPVYQINKDGSKNLDLLLTAPKGIENFTHGDTIEMDLEWITLHRVADDYYGPNEAYRQHLETSPNSWETTYREATRNHLEIEVSGGALINKYPILLQAQSNEVNIQIKGGVGYVPIRFEGLESATGYTLYLEQNGKRERLDQSVHGNDFWQTDYDATTNSFMRTYNLPLDDLETSTWVLVKD